MNRFRFFKLCHGHGGIVILILAAQHVIAQTNNTTMPSSTRHDEFHDKGSNQSVRFGMRDILGFFATTFLIASFLYIYLRHCRHRPFPFSRSHRASISLPHRDSGSGTDISLHHRARGTNIFDLLPRVSRGHGLDPAVVNSFPTFLYSQVKGHRIGQIALECAVCLLEFEDDQILRLLPKCSHVFHPDCIDTWLALHDTCPLCRANLVPKPGELPTRVTTTLFPRDSDSILTESSMPPAGYGAGDAGSGSVDNVDLIIDITDATMEHQMLNQNRPPRSTPRKPKNAGSKFHRSHSTGHSIVQPVDNHERFTLRLPEDVRSQLMKGSPSTSSTGVFMSPRKGYRSSSVGTSRGKSHVRLDSVGRSGGRNLRMMPPFLSQSQAGSFRSPANDLSATPKNLMKSIKSSLDRLDRYFRPGTEKDDSGRPSTSRLNPDGDA